MSLTLPLEHFKTNRLSIEKIESAENRQISLEDARNVYSVFILPNWESFKPVLVDNIFFTLYRLLAPTVCYIIRNKTLNLHIFKNKPKVKFYFKRLFRWFLGRLSLHLNHLIALRTANYNWPFGALTFGLFCSNLDTRDLETYPRTYFGHFWNMSLFDNFRAV